MRTALLDAIKERPLLADGAMGTQLMLAGLEQGRCGEQWNLTHPEKVLGIQRRYVEAGSDCLLTNTFGGSRIMLNRHGASGDVDAINRAAVEIAREAFTSAGREGWVIGDVGPFGGLMEPYGEFTEAEVRDAFAEQAAALVNAGADAIIVETQTSLEELGLGIAAAREAGAPCIIGSLAYDVTLDGSTFRTMMGIDPERAAEFMQENGAHVVALNCGTGMDMTRAKEAVERYRQATDLPVMAQPNAGQPCLVNMKVVYNETPEQMVAGVVPLLEAGASIIGGCCGSTPDHIRAFRAAMDQYLTQRA
ncbi:homocysteine S-methyltransferase (plasmid) [Gemmatirosa kalamazoonensis]|uniref:Homocysteine S-methyltransferase n=1 Tax=Gemmatirosa kalamazoonensis TaxID=861299 RepID=W0RR70_9BACT|nr:homocysteine S-methyltransferase family protein [Gemmatirosa kalamazoonensis]AHG92967.1 homocysteine S-methyltransferase [Gemmatirosa kalamazoonensis]